MHRDLKPSNIAVNQDCELRVRLFPICRVRPSSSIPHFVPLALLCLSHLSQMLHLALLVLLIPPSLHLLYLFHFALFWLTATASPALLAPLVLHSLFVSYAPFITRLTCHTCPTSLHIFHFTSHDVSHAALSRLSVSLSQPSSCIAIPICLAKSCPNRVTFHCCIDQFYSLSRFTAAVPAFLFSSFFESFFGS